MSNTVNTRRNLLESNQLSAEVLVNDFMYIADLHLGLEIKGIMPGDRPNNPALLSPLNGQTWLIGASPVGDWAGSAGQIAHYYNGWVIIPPFSTVALDTVTDVYWAFNGEVNDWHPLQDLWHTDEHWTGKLAEDGVSLAERKIYSKTLPERTWPNNTSSAVAHGVTGIRVGANWHSRINTSPGGPVGPGNINHPCPVYLFDVNVACYVTSTTVVLVTDGGNWSSFSSDIRIEYQKA